MQREVPIGTISIWSGSIVDIPSTYRLCDGTNGTPDLRNKFVTGSGDTYAVDAVGGNVNHLHTFDADLHAHFMGGPSEFEAGANFDQVYANALESGTSDNANGLPPYHSLVFVMYAGVPR